MVSHQHASDSSSTPKGVVAAWLLGPWNARTEAVMAGLCGLFLLLGWLGQLATGEIGTIVLLLFLLSYLFGGYPTLVESIRELLEFRFEIDLLMLVAALGAAALGNWAEGALLLFLFSLAHALEHLAMGRARRAIEKLADLAPKMAEVRRNGRTATIPVDQLQVGDIVLVKPNTRIAADGFVVAGDSEVDQSPITGESIPVRKSPVENPDNAAEDFDNLDAHHRVFAGTINSSGSIDIKVMRVTGDSTLSRVVKMVKEAKTKRSPTQHFTQRFERWFVPSVLLFVGVLIFAWVVVPGETFESSFYRAMAVLVGASPCALAISTPSAVLSGVARAARGGVLIKGGGPLESLGRIRSIAFDKTGTLTRGEPHLTDVVPFDENSEEELLRLALAIEQRSDHPLARAVVEDGRKRISPDTVPAASEMQNLIGQGIQGTVNGTQVFVGKPSAVAEVTSAGLTDDQSRQLENLATAGRTTMVVVCGDQVLGALGVMDTPRESARSVMRELKRSGVDRLVMISGDNQAVANAIGEAVGIDEARGELMPEDKVSVIQSLQKGGVAMIGDGVNDAPAMARATVGIAMGAAGSDVALETADIALMADDLARLPFAVALSRQTARIIRQNIWISLGMVALLVPLTLFGLPMAPAVVLHEGSTLVVVLNALRLLGFPDMKLSTENAPETH